MNADTVRVRNSAVTPPYARYADSIRILLRDLIDYAGLFPPASLSMKQSMANFDRYLRSEWSWILGRFVAPVARLDELETAFVELPPLAAATGPVKYRLSVLLGSDVAADIASIGSFNERMTKTGGLRTAVIESVEAKVASAEEIRRLSAAIPAELETYFEFPMDNCAKFMATVCECGRRAKIRTGGETADKFPDSGSVIEFVRLCAAAKLPFKATAGLHHPVRSAHQLTYHPDSPSGVMHGFLNVFLAAAFLRVGMDEELTVQLLEEQSAQAFRFEMDGVAWREYRLSLKEIADARARFSISFGSCSFNEPLNDLRSLDIL
jgi:hypothetical protein